MLTLADIDNLYKTTISKLPKDSRLWYCTRHLDKLQLILINNSKILDEHNKEKLKEMVRATQNEIKLLNE